MNFISKPRSYFVGMGVDTRIDWLKVRDQAVCFCHMEGMCVVKRITRKDFNVFSVRMGSREMKVCARFVKAGVVLAE